MVRAAVSWVLVGLVVPAVRAETEATVAPVGHERDRNRWAASVGQAARAPSVAQEVPGATRCAVPAESAAAEAPAAMAETVGGAAAEWAPQAPTASPAAMVMIR